MLHMLFHLQSLRVSLTSCYAQPVKPKKKKVYLWRQTSTSYLQWNFLHVEPLHIRFRQTVPFSATSSGVSHFQWEFISPDIINHSIFPLRCHLVGKFSLEVSAPTDHHIHGSTLIVHYKARYASDSSKHHTVLLQAFRQRLLPLSWQSSYSRSCGCPARWSWFSQEEWISSLMPTAAIPTVCLCTFHCPNCSILQHFRRISQMNSL